MNWSEIVKLLGNCDIKGEKIFINSNLYETVKLIKDTYHFDLLKNITAIDRGDSIELDYYLYSTKDNENIIISILTNQEIESLYNLFDSACADEKEIYDLFGIKFVGNPELKRLYMPESWKGHPLKKDYVEKDERLRWND